MTEPAARATLTSRDATIDLARGLAITAIVLGHVLRGLSSAEILDPQSEAVVLADKVLYSFHLPVFAFLSGLFIQDAVSREGTRRYLRQRDMQFLYLFVLWSFIQGGVKLLASARVNSPTSVAQVLRLWEPEGQLWFLPFLIIATTATVLVRPWRSRILGVASVVVASVLSLASWGEEAEVIGRQGLPLILFLLLGALWGARSFRHLVAGVTLNVALLTSVASTILFLALVLSTPSIPPTTDSGARESASVPLGVTVALLGVVAVLAVARYVAQLPELKVVGPAAAHLVRALGFVGRRTLEIFLAHIVAASGTRIALRALGLFDPAGHIVFGTLAGVLFPIVLWAICRKLNFPYLFRAPAALTGVDRSRGSDHELTPL